MSAAVSLRAPDASEAPRGVSSLDREIADDGAAMGNPTVMLAAKNAMVIAGRQPEAIVIDLANARFFRGNECWVISTSGRATKVFKAAVAILLRIDKNLPHDDLTEILYGHDANGGPDDIGRVYSVLVCNLRPFLKWAGLTVRSRGKILQICAIAKRGPSPSHEARAALANDEARCAA